MYKSMLILFLFSIRESETFNVVSPNYQHQCQTRTRTFLLGETDVNDEKENSDVSLASKKRPPPFPPSSYHLARDESRLRHKFISFIDHFNEPYNQVARLIEPRGYAIADPFRKGTPKNNITISATIDDVACPPSLFGPVATFLSWNRLPARIVVGTMAYFAFPFVIEFLQGCGICEEPEIKNAGFGLDWIKHNLISKDAAGQKNDLASLVNLYLPGVSIVLGTYFSMTLSILYERFSRLQQTVVSEASMLSYCFQNLLALFEDDKEALVKGSQCIADQIGTMIGESRGRETMHVIYNDPYASILRLLRKCNREKELDQQLVGVVRESIRESMELRSKRISDEALGLAPTHFDVMTFLSGLLLFGIALGTVATAQTDGVPTELSRFLFSALVVCYTTIYEMAYDLNRPFDGVYQLRRSGVAMHFLQIKNIVDNHPDLRGKIDFEQNYDLPIEDVPISDANRKAQIWYN